MISLIDTHCHLNFEAFHSDLGQVLERARLSGVEKIVVPATDLASCQEVIELAEAHEGVYAAVGVHPNECAEWEMNSLPRLREYARHEKVVAIGEIGLDYYRDRAPRQVQRTALAQQLELAEEMGLPVIIHNRNASRDVLSILSEWRRGLDFSQKPLANAPGVLHSYSDELKYACEAIDNGFKIGITGPITFNNANELRTAVAQIPLKNLLVETDAPFLTPVPHRGKRNEPAYVRHVAEELARLHASSLLEVAKITSQNARVLFQW
ncbi:MAG: TatD family hydrolase [Anaerolineales bacterium]|nr:TatD family hydrolase [Anaerolineales bacterium]